VGLLQHRNLKIPWGGYRRTARTAQRRCHPSLFVIEEVEARSRTILRGGTAKLVPNQSAAVDSGLVVEPRVSGRSGIAVVFIQRAMELILSALVTSVTCPTDDLPWLGPSPATVTRIPGLNPAEWRTALNPELILRHWVFDPGIRPCPGGRRLRHQAGILVIVYIRAVQSKLSGRARPQHFSVGSHACLHAQQFHHISRFAAGFASPHLAERIAHTGVCRVHL